MTYGERDASTQREVARLYDEHPYPNHGVVSDVVARMLQPVVEAARSQVSSLRLLDAGCGTGEQSLGIKRRFPEIDVVGVDFNPKSVARAGEFSRRYGISVRFEHADVLADLEAFGRFNLVTSVGVLHHLDRPQVALQRLARVTEPGGRMLGMVYGRFGRQAEFLLRDAVRVLTRSNWREEALELLGDVRRSARRPWQKLIAEYWNRRRYGPDVPWQEAVRRLRHRHGATYRADAYTHAQELSFTYREVDELLQMNEWRFDGWPRRCGMPDSPDQVVASRRAATLRARPILELADVYERIIRPANLYFLATRPAAPHGAHAES